MRIKTILCPVDLSDVSRRAFGYAVAIARTHGARLSVLRVIDWGAPGLEMALSLPPPPPDDVTRGALEGLNDFAAPAHAAGVPTEVCIEIGAVTRHILDRVASLSADLLVLGTHGRGGFDRAVLGSVAEEIVRKAS